MIGGDTVSPGHDQYTSCKSTLKAGCRQPYHSAAPEQYLKGKCMGRGKRWLWMCVSGRLGALGHENTMHALTNGVHQGINGL